jgi:hypothetical protein
MENRVEYNKYKKFFDGIIMECDIIFLKKYCPIEDHPMIDNIINMKKYFYNNDTGIFSMINNDDKIGCVDIFKIIDEINKLKYQEDCEKYIQLMKQKAMNKYQKNILTQIISKKPHDLTYIDLPQIEKCCPHCEKKNMAPLGTVYIICGVDSQGLKPINNYDESCLNDWCFDCGKKLCKNWNKDNLFVVGNRIHNNECCRKHAQKNGNKYPEDYCQCENNRKSNVS